MLSWPTSPHRPSRRWSSNSSPPPITANAGRGIGWTSPATPRARVSKRMKRGPTSGAIAITSSNRSLRTQMAEIEAPKRKEIEEDLIHKYPQEIQDVLAKRPEERTSFEWLMYHKARQYLDPTAQLYIAPTSAVVAKLKPAQKEQW